MAELSPEPEWVALREAHDARDHIAKRRYLSLFVYLAENLQEQGYSVFEIADYLSTRPRHVKGALKIGAKIRALLLDEENAARFRKRDHGHRRRADALGLDHEPVDLWTVWLRDRGVCHLCGNLVSTDDVDFDHVIPLARGGTHNEANIAVSHASCNRSKGAR